MSILLDPREHGNRLELDRGKVDWIWFSVSSMKVAPKGIQKSNNINLLHCRLSHLPHLTILTNSSETVLRRNAGDWWWSPKNEFEKFQTWGSGAMKPKFIFNNQVLYGTSPQQSAGTWPLPNCPGVLNNPFTDFYERIKTGVVLRSAANSNCDDPSGPTKSGRR